MEIFKEMCGLVKKSSSEAFNNSSTDTSLDCFYITILHFSFLFIHLTKKTEEPTSM
jgi:hypothetical protein